MQQNLDPAPFTKNKVKNFILWKVTQTCIYYGIYNDIYQFNLTFVRTSCSSHRTKKRLLRPSVLKVTIYVNVYASHLFVSTTKPAKCVYEITLSVICNTDSCNGVTSWI